MSKLGKVKIVKVGGEEWIVIQGRPFNARPKPASSDSNADKRLRLITVHMPEHYIDGLDALVERGLYPTRSEAIRTAVRDLLKKELWRRKRRSLRARMMVGL